MTLAGVTLVCLSALTMPRPVAAGAWTQGEGNLWLKLGASLWRTDRKFAGSLDTELVFQGRADVRAGDRIPFDPTTGGELTAMGLTLEAQYGIYSWLDVGVTMPLLWTDFDTSPVDTVDGRIGVGDIRVSARAGLPRLGGWALAGRLEFKVPTGDFDPSVFQAPLTEGQADIGAWLSAGVSLHPWGYTNAEIGYLLRFENGGNERRPGNEVHALFEAGLDLPAGFMLKGAIDGLFGAAGEQTAFGTSESLPRRRLFSAWLGPIWQIHEQLWFDAMGRYLIAGEDIPAGWQISFGVATRLAPLGS